MHDESHRSGHKIEFHENVAYAASTGFADGTWIVAGGLTSNTGNFMKGTTKEHCDTDHRGVRSAILIIIN